MGTRMAKALGSARATCRRLTRLTGSERWFVGGGGLFRLLRSGDPNTVEVLGPS